MAQNIINVGTVDDDNTGDTLRAAFQKVNSNETELYSRITTNATLAPTATDDSFEIGTRWIKEDTDQSYTCVDNTPSTAVWIEDVNWLSTSSDLVTTGTADTGALGVTGDITVTGTVDGRDIGVDGTKLDNLTITNVNVLLATSTDADQQPTETDDPVQVNFGPAQFGGGDPVSIDADGTMTFNQGGSYLVNYYFQFGRTGSPGTSELFLYSLLDFGGGFIPVGDGVYGASVSSDAVTPVQLALPFVVSAGWKLKNELVRDSSGNNSGGLFQKTPTLGTVPTAPSASVIIFRQDIA